MRTSRWIRRAVWCYSIEFQWLFVTFVGRVIIGIKVTIEF
jgi:hypothetical protein